jgi:hypothetical protein
MTSLYHIRGSHFVNTPISVNSDGSIEITFTNTNFPSSNHLNPRLFPKYSVVAKPRDLATNNEESWLTYYRNVDLSNSTNIINITAHAVAKPLSYFYETLIRRKSRL